MEREYEEMDTLAKMTVTESLGHIRNLWMGNPPPPKVYKQKFLVSYLEDFPILQTGALADVKGLLILTIKSETIL